MEVEALPIEQASHAKTFLDEGRDLTLRTLRAPADRAPNKSVSSIDQCKRGEDGRGFAELDVDQGAPRRSKALSMQGKSSNISEAVWKYSSAMATLWRTPGSRS